MQPSQETQTDAHFFGKNYEEGKIYNFFDHEDKETNQCKTSIVNLWGDPGIGKTIFCNHLEQIILSKGLFTVRVIDFKEIRNRSIISIIKCFLEKNTTKHFEEINYNIDSYHRAKGIRKQNYYNTIVSLFFDLLKKYYSQKKLYFFFDTCEVISKTKFENIFYEFLKNCKNKCNFVLAGRKKIILDPEYFNVLPLKLRGLEPSDLKSYLKFRFLGSPSIKEIAENTINRIHILTNGHPILCGLTADWIIESPSQIKYITNLPKETFNNELVLWFNALAPLELKVIQLMSLIDKRVNIDIISELLEITKESSTKIFNDLTRFSFIKYNVSECYVTLHEEIEKLVICNLPLSIENKFFYLKKIIDYYDDDISIHFSDNEFKYLAIEKIYYTFLLDSNEGGKIFANYFDHFINIYDHDICRILIDEFSSYDTFDKTILSIAKIDFHLSRYESLEANILINELSSKINEINNKMYLAKINEERGYCYINPCTIENVDIFKSIDYFNEAISLYSNLQDSSKLAYCLFGLAQSYTRIGNNTKANKIFCEALRHSIDNISLRIKILHEKSKNFRLQQQVNEAMHELQKSKNLIQESNNESELGIYYYYLGATYRDLDQFQTATKHFIKAEKIFIDYDDKFKLCELYCDWSWLEYLRNENDFSSAKKFLEKSYFLAKHYNFGTEISEYYHINYEIDIYQKKYNTAYIFLDKSLHAAYKYSNIYIILDCLNHRAQQYYHEEKFNDIFSIIKEMEDFENKGCGIRVFRGRALLVLGDYYYCKSDYKNAFLYWSKGLKIVALFGNSRTNVELYSDLFTKRKEKLKIILNILGEPYKQKLQSFWKKNPTEKQFNDILDFCI